MPTNDSIMHAEHPAPHRDRVSVPLLFFGLFAGPVAWGIQLVANYALASYRCFPAGTPRMTILPGWYWSSPTILAINVVAAIVALIGAGISFSHWRSVRLEREGSASHAVEAGEGRTRFLALWGIMTGLGFFAAIMFDTVALSIVSPCVG